MIQVSYLPIPQVIVNCPVVYVKLSTFRHTELLS